MEKTEKKRILIIKLGAIGDVVMSLSMLEAIKERYNEAEITWITGKASAPILKNIDQINNIYIADDSALLKGNLIGRLRQLVKIWLKLFLKEYDLIVIPYRDKRYRLLALTARGNTRRDFMGETRKDSIIPGRYHSSEYRKLIDGKDDWEMKLPVLPKVDLPHNDKVEGFLAGVNSPFVILAPGGSKNLLADDKLRRWPVENYRELSSCLTDRGISTILIGAETDKWVEKEFEGINIINLIGKTSLEDLIYLFNRCNILISHDTGSLQIAKLTTILSIALFGPVNPRERISETENVEVHWGGESLACSPCYDGKHFADCDNNICMKNIKVSTILESITNRLKNIQQ